MLSTILQRQKRTTAGSMLFVIVAVIIFLTILGVGMVYMTMVVGGNNQMQNAVDAGALNVARRALTDVSVRLEDEEKACFDELLNKNGDINLYNANRIVGKALQIAINETTMEQESASTAISRQNAINVFEMARAILNRLETELNNERNVLPYFQGIVAQNSVRMLGPNTKVQFVRPMKRGYLDVGDRTNVLARANDLPVGFDASCLGLIKEGEEGAGWVPGYQPIELMERVFFLVPQPCRPPHLVSERNFERAQEKPHFKGLPGPDSCIPIVANGFGMSARAEGGPGTAPLVARSAAEADAILPPFKLEMPRAIVRITNRKADYSLKLYENQNGKWGPEIKNHQSGQCLKKWFDLFRPKLDEDNAWKVLTNQEYQNQDLQKMRTRYWQRLREIKSGNADGELQPPLNQLELPEEQGAINFRSDEKGPVHLRLTTDGAILAMAPWLRDRLGLEPDGTTGRLAVALIPSSELDGDGFKAPLPNVGQECKDAAIAVLIDTKYYFGLRYGTGKNGNIGDLEMGRLVTLKFLSKGPAPDTSGMKIKPF